MYFRKFFKGANRGSEKYGEGEGNQNLLSDLDNYFES